MDNVPWFQEAIFSVYLFSFLRLSSIAEKLKESWFYLNFSFLSNIHNLSFFIDQSQLQQ